eukprot:TRINITY_DN3181_c0_g2_i2.p1 TRINITY_DN3181_c0_g2~~TRINITY_DN3181_c0_g2_i2.p1  ORF type:complete len:1215 (-),score=211.11 TRINITY_DN3181_c0_g2_i2:19-3663(-)
MFQDQFAKLIRQMQSLDSPKKFPEYDAYSLAKVIRAQAEDSDYENMDESDLYHAVYHFVAAPSFVYDAEKAKALLVDVRAFENDQVSASEIGKVFGAVLEKSNRQDISFSYALSVLGFNIRRPEYVCWDLCSVTPKFSEQDVDEILAWCEEYLEKNPTDAVGFLSRFCFTYEIDTIEAKLYKFITSPKILTATGGDNLNFLWNTKKLPHDILRTFLSNFWSWADEVTDFEDKTSVVESLECLFMEETLDHIMVEHYPRVVALLQRCRGQISDSYFTDEMMKFELRNFGTSATLDECQQILMLNPREHEEAKDRNQIIPFTRALYVVYEYKDLMLQKEVKEKRISAEEAKNTVIEVDLNIDTVISHFPEDRDEYYYNDWERYPFLFKNPVFLQEYFKRCKVEGNQEIYAVLDERYRKKLIKRAAKAFNYDFFQDFPQDLWLPHLDKQEIAEAIEDTWSRSPKILFLIEKVWELDPPKYESEYNRAIANFKSELKKEWMVCSPSDSWEWDWEGVKKNLMLLHQLHHIDDWEPKYHHLYPQEVRDRVVNLFFMWKNGDSQFSRLPFDTVLELIKKSTDTLSVSAFLKNPELHEVAAFYNRNYVNQVDADLFVKLLPRLDEVDFAPTIMSASEIREILERFNDADEVAKTTEYDFYSLAALLTIRDDYLGDYDDALMNFIELPSFECKSWEELQPTLHHLKPVSEMSRGKILGKIKSLDFTATWGLHDIIEFYQDEDVYCSSSSYLEEVGTLSTEEAEAVATLAVNSLQHNPTKAVQIARIIDQKDDQFPIDLPEVWRTFLLSPNLLESTESFSCLFSHMTEDIAKIFFENFLRWADNQLSFGERETDILMGLERMVSDETYDELFKEHFDHFMQILKRARPELNKADVCVYWTDQLVTLEKRLFDGHSATLELCKQVVLRTPEESELYPDQICFKHALAVLKCFHEALDETTVCVDTCIKCVTDEQERGAWSFSFWEDFVFLFKNKSFASIYFKTENVTGSLDIYELLDDELKNELLAKAADGFSMDFLKNFPTDLWLKHIQQEAIDDALRYPLMHDDRLIFLYDRVWKFDIEQHRPLLQKAAKKLIKEICKRYGKDTFVDSEGNLRTMKEADIRRILNIYAQFVGIESWSPQHHKIFPESKMSQIYEIYWLWKESPELSVLPEQFLFLYLGEAIDISEWEFYDYEGSPFSEVKYLTDNYLPSSTAQAYKILSPFLC